MPTRSDVITVLFSTVGRFRRQVRRSANGTGDRLPAGLTESQAELLRLVARHPGISVSQAATELGLAANTTSTLVSKLIGSGGDDTLLVRDVDPGDRRVGRLRLTTSAQQVADASRAARRAVIADVIDLLEPGEIDSLAAGLDVMAKMTRLLQERRQ